MFMTGLVPAGSQMDPYRYYPSVCAMMLCLLGTARLSSDANCPCPNIPKKDFTLPEEGCFEINSYIRYKCLKGFKRKPGTSGLIWCQENGGVLKWESKSSPLECIPNSDYQPEPTISLGVTTQHQNWPGISTSLQSVKTSKATKSPNMEQTTWGDPTKVGIWLPVVILLFTMSGVIFLLYRRINKPILSREAEEQEPMKC